jgi:hypothetical protein
MKGKGLLVVGGFIALVVLVFALQVAVAPKGAGGAGMRLVPADADVVLTADVATLRRVIIVPWVGKMPPAKAGMWGDEALEAEVKELLKGRFGFHVHDVAQVTGFVTTDTKTAAVVFSGEIEGALNAQNTTEYKGFPVFEVSRKVALATVSGDLVIGTPKGVEAVIDLSKGEGDSLAKGGDRAELHQKLREAFDGAGALLVTASLANAPDDYVPFVGGKLEGAAVTLTSDGRWKVAVLGEPKVLDDLKGKIETAIAAGMAMLESEKDRQKASGDTFEALMAIFSVHGIDQLREALKIERDDDVLVASLEIEGMGAAMPMLGVMAAVAIPSFLKYQQRAQAMQFDVEVQERENLRRLREAQESPGLPTGP